MKRGAILSPCGRFRYRLSRTWDSNKPIGVFVMLNPSTADAHVNDPTVLKCIGFARRLGWGGFVVVNLFAYRATDPVDLREAGYPVGDQNDKYLRDAAWRAKRTGAPVVVAWGRKGHKLHARVSAVLSLLQGIPLCALRVSADGAPNHPLMLPYTTDLHTWSMP